MTNLVVEVSRYLIILLIAIYTYYNFRFFSMKDQEGRDLACSRQLVCMFMLHFLANMVIVLNTGLESLALFYGAQVIFFLCYIYLYRFFYRNVSRLLVNNTLYAFMHQLYHADPVKPLPGHAPVCDRGGSGCDHVDHPPDH